VQLKRALALLLLSGCSLRAPRVDNGAPPCSSTLQCDRPDICFLGECRGHAAALSLVGVEVRPPNDSLLGVAKVSQIDLHQSILQDFRLQPLSVEQGSVLQAQDGDAGVVPVPGALVAFTEHDPAIPDRVEQVLGRSDNGGAFTARLPQGVWDIVVQASAPLPPFRPDPFSAPGPALSLVLPRVTSLAKVDGWVTAAGAPLAGANVTAVDSAGLLLSSPAVAQADGGYQLYLPPGTTGYLLQVGPPQDLDGGAALSALDPLPNYDHLAPATTVDVPLPPSAVLQGKVLDRVGAPIPSALVFARSDGMPWNLSRSTTAGADGSYKLALRAGNFVVEAAPSASPDAPGVSLEKLITLPEAGATLDLPCPPKVRGYGFVLTPTGATAGSNYQVTATRVADRLLTTRTAFSTPTKVDGMWNVVADPGRYRVEVVPPPDTGLPRKIVQLDLEGSDHEVPLPPIQISPPLQVVGTVHGAPPGGSDAPVAGATVSFFSLDAAGKHTVFLGSSLTDAKGRYLAILPDVAQPGSAY
jgi:hypothetical protein